VGGDLRPPPPPSAFQAAVRGVGYGVLALGLVIGAIYLFRGKLGTDVVRTESAAGPDPAKAGPKPVPAKAEEPAPTSHPTEAPLIAVNDAQVPAPAPTPTTDAANPPASAPTPSIPAVEKTPAVPNPPAAEPTMAAPPPVGANSAASFTPAPPPPGATPPALAPADAPAPPTQVVRNSATLTQAVTVQLQFGKVTLNPGTKVRLIAIEGPNVRVNFNNNIVLMPIASTDVDPANTVVVQPPAAVTAPASPVPAPTMTPAVPPAPTTPTAPKSPLDDL
jgi:hypothetical protein